MAGISAINNQLTELGNFAVLITVYQSKYLNNVVEQNHRFIKKSTQRFLLDASSTVQHRLALILNSLANKSYPVLILSFTEAF
jgi:transposase-like protein